MNNCNNIIDATYKNVKTRQCNSTVIQSCHNLHILSFSSTKLIKNAAKRRRNLPKVLKGKSKIIRL